MRKPRHENTTISASSVDDNEELSSLDAMGGEDVVDAAGVVVAVSVVDVVGGSVVVVAVSLVDVVGGSVVDVVGAPVVVVVGATGTGHMYTCPVELEVTAPRTDPSAVMATL